MKRLPVLLVAVALAALLGSASTASASPILPGFDLFSTPAGGAFLPSPGGPIALMGNPIGPFNTDTIVERTTGPADGETGVIETEIVALSLRSVDPVDLDPSEVDSFFDVFVTLDPENPSTGQVNVTSHGTDGGFFDSFFDVFVQVEFVPVVGNTAHAFTQSSGESDPITSTGSPWSHTPPPSYPNDPQYPSGGFYPGTTEHTGPHKITEPAQTPEPASIIVWSLLGAVAMAAGWWRRRRGTA